MLREKQNSQLAVADMSERAYEEFVAGRFDEAARATATPIIFTNRGTPHAKAVLEQIIARAQKTLDIYSGGLSAEVYDSASLTAASARGVAIRIIVADTAPGRTALSGMRDEAATGKIAVKQFAAFVMKDQRREPLKHFAIGDLRHIRAEDDAADRSATVMLNVDCPTKKAIVDAYIGIFNYMWDKGAVWGA